ncbi:MAG: PD-(D/E)XK nuclease family protein [Patescibacteria group bacterium]|jgi:RecB family exonuclease
MSQYYQAKRKTNLYQPGSAQPFKLSRSKIDLFLQCPRCFYLDRKLGVARPPGFPFNLNSAVDTLLKKEFDVHRQQQTPHPLMEHYGVKAVPFQHHKMNEWRENFKGVQFHHLATNFIITGAVDDIWVTPQQELMVVDYKATSKAGTVNLDAEWQIGYKRQMEVYQWLLRNNGFNVSDTGYFVYCNGQTDRPALANKLDFEIILLPYQGKAQWVEEVITQAAQCLNNHELPQSGAQCDFCAYVEANHAVTKPVTKTKRVTNKKSANKTKLVGTTGFKQRSLF